MPPDPRLKVVCISDTHNANGRLSVPKGDLLVHAGDLTQNGTEKELRAGFQWLNGLPHPWKVFVPGNHDYLFATEPERARQMALEECPDLWVLIDEGVQFDGGLRVWGMPWVLPWRHIRNFYADEDTIRDKMAHIPDVDVLVTHQPPRGVLDKVDAYDKKAGRPAGSERVWQWVYEAEPRLHVFGHLHLGYGRERHYGLYGRQTTFVNAAQSKGLFGGPPFNEPVVVRLEDRNGR